MNYRILSSNFLVSKRRIAFLLLSVILLNSLAGIFSAKSYAAGLTEAMVRLDRMGADAQFNTTTGYKILVLIKPTTVGTIGKVRLTFPTSSAFTVNATASNFDTSITGLPSTVQGEAVTGATITNTEASAVSGGDVTFDVTSMSSATTLYGFYLTCNATTCITNPSGGNAGTHIITVATLTAASAAIDSTQVAVDTLSSSTSDQVTVTASVAPTFNFTMADQTLALGTLSPSSVSTNAMSPGIDIDTNAGNGYAVWIRSEGATAALVSASTGGSISSTNTGSVVTCSSGTNCYVVDIATAQGGASTGSLAPTTEFDGNGTTSGGVLSIAYEEVAYSTGQADSDTITPTVIAAISPVQEAATDYTDTWDVVAAGNF